MKNFWTQLEKLASSNEIKLGAKSINQTQRNQLMLETMLALLSDFASGCEEDSNVYTKDNVNFALIDNKTIEFNIDNENVGILPMRIAISFPNINEEEDLYTKAEEYQRKIADKLKKKQEEERIKAEKIKRDTLKREQKKKELEGDHE